MYISVFLPLTFCREEHPSRFSTQFEEQIWRPIRDCCLTLTDHHKGRRTLYQISKHMAALDTHLFAFGTSHDSCVRTGKSVISKAERKYRTRGETPPWRKNFVIPQCIASLMSDEKVSMFKSAVLKDLNTSAWQGVSANGDWQFHSDMTVGEIAPVDGGAWTASVVGSALRDRKVRYVVVPPGTGVGIASRICTDSVTASINGLAMAPVVRKKTVPLRVAEAGALCTAYRAKCPGATQVGPTVSKMTLYESKSTGDAGLLAELWKHVDTLGGLTETELVNALGSLVPEDHTVVGVTETDQATAAHDAESEESGSEQEESEEEEPGEESEEEDEEQGGGSEEEMVEAD